MAKTLQIVVQANPTMNLLIIYVITMVVTAAVIYVANMFFPKDVVLGTMSLTMMWALALSSMKIAVVTVFASAFFTEWELRRARLLSPMEMMAGYFVVNLAVLWFITRFADVFGLGVTSWMVLVALAVVLDIVQGMAVMAYQKMKMN